MGMLLLHGLDQAATHLQGLLRITLKDADMGGPYGDFFEYMGLRTIAGGCSLDQKALLVGSTTAHHQISSKFTCEKKAVTFFPGSDVSALRTAVKKPGADRQVLVPWDARYPGADGYMPHNRIVQFTAAPVKILTQTVNRYAEAIAEETKQDVIYLVFIVPGAVYDDFRVTLESGLKLNTKLRLSVVKLESPDPLIQVIQVPMSHLLNASCRCGRCACVHQLVLYVRFHDLTYLHPEYCSRHQPLPSPTPSANSQVCISVCHPVCNASASWQLLYMACLPPLLLVGGVVTQPKATTEPVRAAQVGHNSFLLCMESPACVKHGLKLQVCHGPAVA
jgi:hypothetical protein